MGESGVVRWGKPTLGSRSSTALLYNLLFFQHGTSCIRRPTILVLCCFLLRCLKEMGPTSGYALAVCIMLCLVVLLLSRQVLFLLLGLPQLLLFLSGMCGCCCRCCCG